MSVAFSGGNFVYRTAEFDPDAAYTAAFWIKFVATTSDYQLPWTVGENATGDSYDNFAINTSNASRLEVSINSSANSDFGSTLSFGTWYHIAIRRNAVDDLDLLINGSVAVTLTDDVTGRIDSTPQELIGAWFGGSYAGNVRVAGYKAWTAALSDAEISTESSYYNAYLTTNLVSQTPMFGASLSEGLTEWTGGSWSQSGTPTINTDNPSGVTFYLPWLKGVSTGTTSATPATHVAGDWIVIAAFRDGSTTAPSLPGSQNWVDFETTTNGGNTCSIRIEYKQAASSGETTGTFTSATSVICAVLDGTKVSYVATNADFGTGSSTTVNYPSKSDVWDSQGFSNYLLFAGHRSTNTALETPPAYATNVSNVQDATDEMALHVTYKPVTSWSSTNVSVGGTSSGYKTAVIELVMERDVAAITDIPWTALVDVATATMAKNSDGSGGAPSVGDEVKYIVNQGSASFNLAMAGSTGPKLTDNSDGDDYLLFSWDSNPNPLWSDSAADLFSTLLVAARTRASLFFYGTAGADATQTNIYENENPGFGDHYEDIGIRFTNESGGKAYAYHWDSAATSISVSNSYTPGDVVLVEQIYWGKELTVVTDNTTFNTTTATNAIDSTISTNVPGRITLGGSTDVTATYHRGKLYAAGVCPRPLTENERSYLWSWAQSKLPTPSGTVTINTTAATIAATGEVDVAGTASITTAAATISSTAEAASTEVFGVASIDTDDATTSAAGTVLVQGTATITTTAATIAAAATVENHGTATITTADATTSATGEVDVAGTASITTAAATVTSAGTVESHGTASITTANATTTATGTVEVHADANIVGVATISATGAVAAVGTFTTSTDAATISSTGTVLVQGTSTITTEAATISAASASENHGTASITTASATITSTGTSEVKALGTLTLASATLTSTGQLLVNGTSTISTTAATITSTAAAETHATASITTANATISSSGTVENHGTATITTNAAIAATGTVENHGTATIATSATIVGTGTVPVVAQSTITTDATIAATGTVLALGTSTINTGAATISSAGAVLVQGSTTIATDSATISAEASSALTGVAAIATADATITSTAVAPVTATATITTAAAISSSGTAPVLAQSTLTTDATLVATGAVAVVGTSTIATAATIAATGVLPVNGESTITTGATITSTGVVPVVASSSLTTDSATIASTATNPVLAVSAITTDGATVAATGESTISGAATITTNASVNATGKVEVQASATLTTSATIDAEGTATPVTVGVAIINTNAATITSTGESTISGAATISTSATVVGTGTVSVSGEATISTSSAVSATGAVAAVGTATVNTSDAAIVSTGIAPIYGTVTITTTAATLAATAEVDVAGAATITTDASTLASTGVVPVQGSSSITTANATIASTGVVPVQGSSSITTANATLVSTSTVETHGIAAITTADATIISTSTVENHGTAIIATDATLVSTSTVETHGIASITTDAATIISTGVVPVNGEATISTDTATIASTGVVPVQGTTTITTDTATVDAVGYTTTFAVASITTEAATIDSTVYVQTQSTVVITTDDATIVATGHVPIVYIASAIINTDNASISSQGIVGAFRERSAVQRFRVFDGLQQTGKPALSFEGLTLVDEATALNGGNSVPSDEYIKDLADQVEAVGKVTSIRIESWDATSDTDLSTKYAPYTLKIEEDVGVTPFGFSDLLPATFSNATSDSPQALISWRSLSANVVETTDLNSVDVLTPNFYVIEADIRTWVKKVRRSVELCREVAPRKPLYPYVWFRYHPTQAPVDLQNQLLPRAHWRTVLETVFQLCDGMILLGTAEAWDPDGAWWHETEEFLREYGKQAV